MKTYNLLWNKIIYSPQGQDIGLDRYHLVIIFLLNIKLLDIFMKCNDIHVQSLFSHLFSLINMHYHF